MHAVVAESCSARPITRTFSTARNTRTIHVHTNRPQRSVVEMLREIAAVLHYTRVCRELDR